MSYGIFTFFILQTYSKQGVDPYGSGTRIVSDPVVGAREKANVAGTVVGCRGRRSVLERTLRDFNRLEPRFRRKGCACNKLRMCNPGLKHFISLLADIYISLIQPK
jgi:hypothetical protein